MNLLKPLSAIVVAAVLAMAGAAAAQAPLGSSSTGQPDSFEVNGKAYVVDGYRSAKWGMTPAQVRRAIPKDFPDAQIGADAVDPVSRATLLVIGVPHLSPGPGPMAISYIFGATTGRLIHVNLDWQFVDATPGNQLALTVAGSRVVADFAAYYWKLLSSARGVPVGPTSLVLFAGAGEAGGAVEVRLQGVGYKVQTAKGVVDLPAPKGGQALLHVGFAQTDRQPDVYTIKPGEF